MKKICLFISAIAAGAIFFSCAKEIETPAEKNEETPEVVTPVEETFEYVFRISDAEGDEETKTTLDGTTVKWESNDPIGVFAEGTTNKFGKITTLDPVEFPIYLTAALSVGDMVYAYYPYSTANNSATASEISLIIPASQTGDFDAMPQVALPYETTSAMATGTNNTDELRFCNLGSVIRFFVYSSTGAYTSETVESIKFTSDKAIAGSFSFDLTGVDYDDQSTLEISGYSATSVTLTAEPTIGTSTSNAGVAEMVIAPGTYYGTIVLTTDVAKYTYTIAEANKITFDRSKIKKIGLNLESATCERLDPHPVGEVFVPATSISAGDKIVIASGTNGTVCVFGEDRGNNRLGYSYTIDDGVIVSDSNIYPLTVGAGITQPSYFTLYDPDNDGYIAASSSSSNNLKTNASINDDAEWQIVVDSESKATTFVATGSSYTRKYLRHNSSNTPPLFSAYAEGKQDDVYIFKMSSSTVVAASDLDIAYTVTSVEIPYNVFNASGSTTVAFKTNPGSCASNLAINEGTKKVTFDITANTGDLRTIEVNITNNGVTKTVSITQAAAPTKLVMSTITATPYEDHIVFTWPEVSGATGYAISINNGSSYDTPQTDLSYDWTGLDALTPYTIYIKAIGDGGIYYSDSDPASKSSTTLAPTLALPASFTWTKATKTISWTDPNTSAGTYGIDYKYVYTVDDGVSTTDANTSTTAVLSIAATTNVKIKAVALTSSHQSSVFSSNITCTIGDALAGIPVSWPITAGSAPTITSNTFSSTATSAGTATLQLCNSSGTAQTLTTTTASSGTGVYNSSFAEGWYWLFAIPVENLMSTDKIKIQVGLYNNASQTYTIYYSTDNKNWTNTSQTIAQTTSKSTAVKSASFTTTNIAEGTLYIKLVGGTTTSSRLVKEIGFSIVDE